MSAIPKPHETIERKAQHFVRWHPTSAARLQQLNEMATFAAHFNPQWKTTNMVSNATRLFAALEQHNVRYLVIGGFAATIFGVPRFTYDVDIFVENTPANINALLTALVELGSDMASIVKGMNPTFVTMMEFDDLSVKTDVLVNVPGLIWEEAWANRVPQSYQGQAFYTVSRADLIKAKRAAGRWQDLEDVKALEATAENS
ncbi:MAG: nucleotidyltransferase [Caldilineaceae bacterium]